LRKDRILVIIILSDEELKWKFILTKYENYIQQINKLIDKYNLIVPIMQNQFFRINLEKFSNENFKE